MMRCVREENAKLRKEIKNDSSNVDKEILNIHEELAEFSANCNEYKSQNDDLKTALQKKVDNAVKSVMGMGVKMSQKLVKMNKKK